MSAADVKNDPVLQALVGGVKEALGTRLRSVVLYGSGARGDYHRGTSDANPIVVLEVLGHDRERTLGRLLSGSYPAFAALFRGGLHLMGRQVPPGNRDVVAAFCDAAGLERAPFEEVARLRSGEKTAQDLRTIYARYYE